MRETKRTLVLVVLVAAVLIAADATAIEVKLRDGSVLQADSYKMTGSYVMLTLANGRKVAYAVEDVDVDHLKEQERAAEPPPEQPAQEQKTGLGTAFGGPIDKPDSGQSTFTLTDQDVGHVRRRPEGLDEEEESEDNGAASSGSVTIQGLEVEPVDESGKYQVRGRVVNGTTTAIRDVRISLNINGTEKSINVAGTLGAGKESNFQHSFTNTNDGDPNVTTTLRYIQPEKPAPKQSGTSDAETEAEAAPGGEGEQ